MLSLPGRLSPCPRHPLFFSWMFFPTLTGKWSTRLRLLEGLVVPPIDSYWSVEGPSVPMHLPLNPTALYDQGIKGPMAAGGLQLRWAEMLQLLVQSPKPGMQPLIIPLLMCLHALFQFKPQAELLEGFLRRPFQQQNACQENLQPCPPDPSD